MLKASHTTDTEVCMVDMVTVDLFTENKYHLIGKRSAEAESKPYYGYGGL